MNNTNHLEDSCRFLLINQPVTMKYLTKFSWIILLFTACLFACNQNTGPQSPQGPGSEQPGGETPGGETPGGGEQPGGEVPGGEGPDTAPDVYVRQNASTAAAAADLVALADAMEEMRNLSCTDARSWHYQGAIHWVPGSFPGNQNPLCPEYTGSGSPLMPAWDNCTHNNVSEFHFLVWHRLYIYYFENIVRELSGKADFALPYWDYATVSPTPPNRVMPASFRDNTNPLFESARLPSLNSGDPIQSFMDNALNLSGLFDNDTYQSFNSAIDAAPHGAMHGYIGGSYAAGWTTFNQIYQETMKGLMANVPSAAFDPIFWAHHAEIDFIWAQWMRTDNGSLPSLADMEANQPINYSFFDKDGNAVNLTIAQAREMAFNLPVTYAPFVENDAIASRTTRSDGLSEVTSECPRHSDPRSRNNTDRRCWCRYDSLVCQR